MNAAHKENLKLIGERIRKLRFARGDSMKIAFEIRAKYGVKLDPSYLSRIERGKTEIPLRTLYAISDYFDLKPTYLMDGNQDNDRKIDPLVESKILDLTKKIGPEKLFDLLNVAEKIGRAMTDNKTETMPLVSSMLENKTGQETLVKQDIREKELDIPKAECG